MTPRRRPDNLRPGPSPEGGADAPGSSLDRELAELRDDYGRRLPDRLRALRGAVARYRRDAQDLESLREARRLAHQLYGTASSLGFAAAGGAARCVLERLPAGAPPASVLPGDWSCIEAALDAADREARG